MITAVDGASRRSNAEVDGHDGMPFTQTQCPAVVQGNTEDSLVERLYVRALHDDNVTLGRCQYSHEEEKEGFAHVGGKE